MNTLGDYFAAQGATKDASAMANNVWFSEPEIRLAEALTRRGLKFAQQVRITREGKTLFILDFLVEGTLAVEVDGREFHEASKDALRDAHVQAKHGIWTLRVSGWRVMHYSEEVVSLIALRLSELKTRAEVLER